MRHQTRILTFKTTLERFDGSRETEEEIEVMVKVQSYAASVGFPDEGGSGLDITITEVLHDGLPLSSDEMEELHSRARDQIHYH